MKTYREDVHRTLTELIEKGMVRPSLDSPTMSAAVDLDNALKSALKKQESELREMEARSESCRDSQSSNDFDPLTKLQRVRFLKGSRK